MKRIFLLFCLLLVLEAFAFSVYRSHPLVRPGYFKPFVLIIQLLMSWGGLYSARWLLRRSPASRAPGPQSDWTRLWVWCGLSGGLLFALACALGAEVYERVGSQLGGYLVVGHLSGGAVAWTIAAFWAIPDVFSDACSTLRDKFMALLGLLAQVGGFCAFLLYFPGDLALWGSPSWVWLLGSSLFPYFLLYYVMAAVLAWALVFIVWRPGGGGRTAPPEPTDAP